MGETQSQLEDRQLMARIRNRDQQALHELYERCGGAVYGIAFRILKHAGMAEEVMQDTFFQAWRWPEKWQPERGTLNTWLLTIARYTAIDMLRRELRRPAIAPSPIDQAAQRFGQRARLAETDHDNAHTLYQYLAQLPKEQRQAIHLAFFRGMTHDEIAAHLNIPVGTVKSRIRLGLQKLKDQWLIAEQ